MAELLKSAIGQFNLKPLLVFQDRVPSVLNGGLCEHLQLFGLPPSGRFCH
jgi:hypothetical protein